VTGLNDLAAVFASAYICDLMQWLSFKVGMISLTGTGVPPYF